MIDLVILTEQNFTPFTLASLLDKSENFRLHLFTRPKIWGDLEPVHKWAMENFRDVYVYQTPFNIIGGHSRQSSHVLARIVLQLKEFWKDKPNTMDRVVVSTGSARLFLQNLDSGQLPSSDWMQDKIAVFPRKWIYMNHPAYKNYYNILGIEAHETDHDKDLIILNWKGINAIENNKLFFKAGPNQFEARATPYSFKDRTIDPEGGKRRWHHEADSYVLSANNRVFVSALLKNKHTFAPTYFNGKLDELIKREAIGPKDVINYNVMLRKSYALSIDKYNLVRSYYKLPTLTFMAIPFDLYAKQIDNIPINLRNEAINEKILEKADKQKKYLRQVVEAGYLLGKI